MSSSIGKEYNFEINRFNLRKCEYLLHELRVHEERSVKDEERFDELHRFLGPQYCHGLEPSVVGYKRCVAHLLLE
jgi:hypothetical protein